MYATKIKSIKKVGEVQTYDLHTPKYHNFLLNNGILSHNSGKSWFDLSLAYDIDPDFDVRQVAFSFEKVMEIIQSDWFSKKKYKIIIFEEVQTSISNREWQGLVNKLFNYLLSTYRHRNIILLMNSPYTDFIDSHARKLIHVVFEIRGHSEITKKTRCRPKILQYNSKLKKFYEHSLYVLRNHRQSKQIYLLMDKPPKHLIKPYEKAKYEFTNNLNKEIISDLEKHNNKEEKNGGWDKEKVKELYDSGLDTPTKFAKALNPEHTSSNLSRTVKKWINEFNSEKLLKNLKIQGQKDIIAHALNLSS